MMRLLFLATVQLHKAQ